MAHSIIPAVTHETLRRGASHRPALERTGLDFTSHRDDFQGDLFKGGAAPGIYQSTASGTASAVAAVTVGANGLILLDSGTDNAGRSDLSLGLYYSGDRNAIVWWCAKVASVATEKFEFGFTDVVSGTDAGAVATKATPTWTADNAAVLVFDTADDTNLTLMGVKATTASAVIDIGAGIISADTFYFFGVELKDTWIRGHLLNANGDYMPGTPTEWIPNGITATTLLTPWAFQQNRTNSAHTMTIDLLDVGQRRTTAS